MAVEIFVKDPLRQAVEAASGGKNTVMYDDKGYPSVMVRIPRFNLESIDENLGTGAHPAFIVHGRTVSEIWIGKYQAKNINGRACSLPGIDPTILINFDTSKAICEAKGEGWHLMNNAERAAIALWCMKNSFYPRGNTALGKNIDATYETASAANYDENKNINRTLTGTGPQSWNHDNTPFGISDLCGNINEWIDGMRLVNGQILLVGEDNTPMNNFDTQNTQGDHTGWIQTGAYYDGNTAGNNATSHSEISAKVVINNKRNYPNYIAEDTDENYAYTIQAFKSVAPVNGYIPPTYLKQLALQPINTDIPEHGLWCVNYGERIANIGGHYANGHSAGIFFIDLIRHRSYIHFYLGLRPAFIAL